MAAPRTRTRSTATRAVPTPAIPAALAVDHASVVVDESGDLVLKAGTNGGVWTHLKMSVPLARALGLRIESITRPAAVRR